MFIEAIVRDNNTIIIDLDIGSRIVTFKLRRDVIRKLDSLVKKYGLGTRSCVLRKLSEAFVRALDEVSNDAVIDNICIRVSYRDSNGSEKTIDVILPK